MKKYLILAIIISSLFAQCKTKHKKFKYNWEKDRAKFAEFITDRKGSPVILNYDNYKNTTNWFESVDILESRNGNFVFTCGNDIIIFKSTRLYKLQTTDNLYRFKSKMYANYIGKKTYIGNNGIVYMLNTYIGKLLVFKHGDYKDFVKLHFIAEK